MPTHKVKGGYKWGKSGKVYPTKKQADKQGQAIYASGWREKKNVNESFTSSKLILMGVLKKVSDELYYKGYDENIIDNSINNENIQLKMNNNGYIFFHNDNIMFHIEPYPNLNEVIEKASSKMIQWFEDKINYIKENKNMTKKQLIRLTESDLHRIIKESVNNILSEKEEAKKKLQQSMMYARHGNNNTHDYKGKAAMNALGMNGEEGKEVAKLDKGVGEYDRYEMDEQVIHNTIMNSVNNIVKEALSDYYDFNQFANDDMVKQYYKSFVIVDGTRAVVGHADNYNEAVEDAKQMAQQNKYGTYEVYGVDNDGTYALQEDYPEDNTLVYSTDEDFA